MKVFYTGIHLPEQQCCSQKTCIDEGKHQCQVWDISLWIISQGGPRGPQNNASLVKVHDCPPSLNDKTLLLKTPHTLVVRHRNQSGSSLKTSSKMASFHGTKRYPRPPWEKKTTVMNHSCYDISLSGTMCPLLQ